MNSSTLSLTIQLPKFEGPLALLLYLIRKEEMDIFDIEIHRITAQYLEYIRMMKELDLEVAGEFIAMASTLIQIKSRMLLPQYNEQGEIIETEDPRKELVQRLLEYQKFQEAGKQLYERPILGRDVWPRGFREKFEERLAEEIELEENALFSLITAFRRCYRASQKRIHKVAAKTQSIASRILEVKDRLLVGIRVGLSDLLNSSFESLEDKRRQVLITFLSSLELAKMGFVRLFQTDAYQEIYIETTRPIETAAVSKVEEYESLHNEEGNAAQDLAPLTLAGTNFEPEPGEATPSGQPMQLSLDESLILSGEADEVALEGFVLKDAEEPSVAEMDLPLFAVEEMASDEEIIAAELELEGQPLSSESVAEVMPETIEVTAVAEEALEIEPPVEEIPENEEVQRFAGASVLDPLVEAESFENNDKEHRDVEA